MCLLRIETRLQDLKVIEIEINVTAKLLFGLVNGAPNTSN